MPDEQIVERLDSIVRLLAILATRDKRQVESIELLSSAGFQPKDIAALLGTTSNTVRVAQSGLRRKERRGHQ